MIVVAHEVDEIQSLCHGSNVVAVVDGGVAGRDGRSDHQVVLVKLASHLSQELSMVLLVLEIQDCLLGRLKRSI